MKVDDIAKILKQESFSKEDLVRLLSANEEGTKLILDRAYAGKDPECREESIFPGADRIFELLRKRLLLLRYP